MSNVLFYFAGVLSAIVVGALLAGYHLWRRRGDETEWAS